MSVADDFKFKAPNGKEVAVSRFITKRLKVAVSKRNFASTGSANDNVQLVSVAHEFKFEVPCTSISSATDVDITSSCLPLKNRISA